MLSSKKYQLTLKGRRLARNMTGWRRHWVTPSFRDVLSYSGDDVVKYLFGRKTPATISEIHKGALGKKDTQFTVIVIRVLMRDDVVEYNTEGQKKR